MELAFGSWLLGPLASIACVYGGACLTSGLSAARYAIRAARFRKQAGDARRAADAEAATLDSGDTVLRGCVEYAPNRDHAVYVTIEQDGSEAESSGSWTVTWTERSRATTVAPFIVVHESGERVRVEPGRETKLEKEVLSKVVRTSQSRRQRIAEIVAGEEVWVTGLLDKEIEPGQGGYRGGRTWVMRPTREPMVVSTLAPEARLTRNTIVSRRLALAFLLTLIAAMASQWTFHALVLDGRGALAHVTSVHDIAIDEGADRCGLVVSIDDERGHTFDDDWDTECQTPAVKAGTTFGSIASFATHVALPGSFPRAHGVPVLVTSFAWLVLVIIARVTRTSKHWFDGVAVTDNVSGRL